MAEAPTPEQLRQLNRSLMENVLDRAEGDPHWKRQHLDDLQAAMLEAGFQKYVFGGGSFGGAGAGGEW